MPVSRLQIGELNMDMGPSPGTHLWVAKDVVMGPGGYDMSPSWIEYSNASLPTSGHVVKGVGSWRGAYTGRVYVATNNRFWELGNSNFTDVTGTTPDNATNGVTFASYGEWCFAANGIDEIQVIKVPSLISQTTNFSDMVYTTNGAKVSPKYICSHKNHIVAANIKFLESYGEIGTHTTTSATEFANQPSGGKVEIFSDNAGEVGNVTVYGTYTGGGTSVTSESIALAGTTTVQGVITNFQKILGVQADVSALGLITIQTVVGSNVITTILPDNSSSGFDAVANMSAGDRVVDVLASGATVRVIGIIGIKSDGTTGIENITLPGPATTVQTINEYRTITNVMIGNLEASRTITLTSNRWPTGFVDPYLVWWSGVDDPEGYGSEVYAPEIVGSSNQPLLDGVGEVTGVIDGGDCFFVFKEGSIHRFDGPPFQPTTISSSVGMSAGNVAYRQNDRVYFWSIAGLRYIDIKSNDVVKAADGTAQRSVTGTGLSVYTGIDASWPTSRTTPLAKSNGACTGSVVSISGDPANSTVFVIYYNGLSATGTHGLVYDEVTNRFTQIVGPSGSNTVGTYIVELRTDSGSETFPIGGNLKCIYKTSPTNMRADSFTRVGFNATTSARDAYLRWPFWSVMKEGVSFPSRIMRVRPLFDNITTSVLPSNFYVKVEVLSVSGVTKSWFVNGKYSTGYDTIALDGWIEVDGVPYSDKHSIGVSVTGLGVPGEAQPYLANFIGIDVEWKAGPNKSL